MHVVLAGGGTAGHVEPALAVADALRRADPEVRITALGTARGLETRLVPERGYELALIPPVPLPRRPSAAMLSLPARVRAAVRAAQDILEQGHADVLVGFGGYVAFPAYLAARRAKVPVVVHEANARPGLANKVGARFAAAVLSATPESTLAGARYVGIPMRQAIATLDRASTQAHGRAHFGLRPDRPTVLVTGGSQGAQHINAAVSGAAPALLAAGVQVLHHTGANNTVAVEVPQGAGPYVTVPYVDRMDLAYAAADLAVCRAGAMTCAELAAVGLPAVYVPLPIGNGEQRLNAAPVVRAGGGVLVEDADLDAAWVAAHVPVLVTDADRLAAMGAAAAALGRRDADEQIAAVVREIGAGHLAGSSS